MVLLAMVVALLMGASLALIALSLSERSQMLRRETQQVQLTALADAGLAKALAKLSLSPRYGGSVEEDLGDGSFKIEVKPIAGRRVKVEVRAYYAGAERRIEAEVDTDPYRSPRVLRWRNSRTGGAER